MIFKVRYTQVSPLPAGAKPLPDYWRTVEGDDLTDARMAADKFARKNYRVSFMQQEDF